MFPSLHGYFLKAQIFVIFLTSYGNYMNSIDQAKQLYPTSLQMQQKWIKAKETTKTIKPHFAKLMPLYEATAREKQFVERVLR